MYLVEVFLPLQDNNGSTFPATQFDEVKNVLIAKFGGVTVFARAPASGIWQTEQSNKEDNLIICEVMVDVLEVDWWHAMRRSLEERFRQREVLIRACAMQRL